MNILLAVLMTLAVSAAAQGHDRRKDGTPEATAGPRARSRDAAAPPAAPEGPAAPKAPAGALEFLRWFSGDKEQPGAYRAPALCCRLARDLSNAYVGPRKGAFRGLSFSLDFVRDVLANAKLCSQGPAVPPGRHGRPAPAACRDDEELGLAADAVLPVPPDAVLAWLKGSDAEGALFRYFSAAESADAPRETLKAARAEFLEVAFAKALQDEDARKAFCAEIEPGSASCPGELAGLTQEQLHAKARAGLGK